MMHFSLHFYQWISAWLAAISLVAFLLNTCVLVIFFTNRRRLLTSANYLLLSMALSDWLRAVFVAPVGAYANARYWWTLHPSFCQYYAFSSTLLGLTSIIHLSGLAVERCYIIKKSSLQEIPKRKMLGVIIGLWSLALAWSIFPLVGWSSFGPEPGYSCCSVQWASPGPADKAYIVSLFVLFFFIPVAVATSCYIFIYKEISKMAADAGRRWGKVAQPTLQTIQAKSKTVRMSLVMIAAFLIAWLPYAIGSLYSSVTSKTVAPGFGIFPALFAKTSICCNPVIYFFMYKRFRVALLKLLPTTKLIGPSDSFERNQDNQQQVEKTEKANVETFG